MARESIYERRKKKYEDVPDRSESSLTSQQLISNYRRRMEAIGIEPPKEETHRGGNPAWNFLKKALNVIASPGAAVMGYMTGSMDEGDSVISNLARSLAQPWVTSLWDRDAVKEGAHEAVKGFSTAIRGKEGYKTGSNYLDILGVENPWVKTIGGLGLDIVSDPTTYIGVGAVTKGGKATKLMGEVTENALKYADELPELGRAASDIIKAADAGLDTASAASRFATTAKQLAAQMADPNTAKALSKMGKAADKYVGTGAKGLSLAPTRAAQAAAGQRGLINFAGHPLIGGEKVFEKLGGAGQALRGSTLGRVTSELFDYGAPLRKTDIGSEGIEKVIEGRRSLPSTKKVAAAAEEARVEDIYKALPEEMRGADIFEQAKREIPIGTKTREIVEPVDEVIDVVRRVDEKVFSQVDETKDVLSRIRTARKSQEHVLSGAKKGGKGKGVAKVATDKDMSLLRQLSKEKEELFDELYKAAPDTLKDYARTLKNAEMLEDSRRFGAFYKDNYEKVYKGGKITEKGTKYVDEIDEYAEGLRRAETAKEKQLFADYEWLQNKVPEEFDPYTRGAVVTPEHLTKEGLVRGGIEPTYPKAKEELLPTKKTTLEYQDEVTGFRPDMTPEQRTVAQQREGLMQEYLEVENAHNIRTKELAELQDQDDILALLYADLPTDYAMHMRSDAAWDYIREHGEESVKGKLKKVLEGPGFTKQRTHRETIDAFNKGMKEKLGVDFDWFETDMMKIDKARGAMHARLVEEAKMLEDWSKITDVDGNPLVRLVGEADEVPEGMQRLPGYLSNYAARDEVITFLERVAPKYSEDGIKTFTELLEVPTSIWRGYATATPGFVGRNAISNFWQLFLKDGAQGLNPRRAWLTAEWMMGKNLDASIVTKSGKIIDGHTFMREATKHNIFEVGIMGSLAPTEEAGAALGTAAKAGGAADEAAKAGLSAVNPLSREFFPVKGIRSINTKVEQHAKAMGYLNDLMKGDSFADAAINTKKFLFDYSRLTPKEKVLRTYAPFMTWTRKNIPLQVEQLIAQPGKFAGVGKVRRSAMDAFSDPETGQYTPGYFDELFAIPTPFNIGGGQMWLNPDLPFQDLQTLTQPKDLWGMLNPLLKAPVELGMDKEMFFGRPIQGEEGRKVRTPAALRWLENIPGVSGLLGMDKIRDYYSEDPNAMTSGMNPRLEYLFRQIPMLNTLSKITDFAAPTEKHVADALSGGLGVKFYQFNPEVEKTSVGWENVQKYQDFMNILQKQYGVDIPSTDTLERFLRYLYGQPVESEYQMRKEDPEVDYLAYLQNLTGIKPPYSLEDILAFKAAYDTGDVTLPSTISAKKKSTKTYEQFQKEYSPAKMQKKFATDPLEKLRKSLEKKYGIAI